MKKLQKYTQFELIIDKYIVHIY